MKNFALLILSAIASQAVQIKDISTENLIQLNQPCVYLNETPAEFEKQLDLFSRNFNPAHW